MCSYAGTGDVLIIQELLAMLSEKVEPPEKEKVAQTSTKPKEANKKAKKVPESDWAIGQAVAALAVASVSFGEEIGIPNTLVFFFLKNIV